MAMDVKEENVVDINMNIEVLEDVSIDEGEAIDKGLREKKRRRRKIAGIITLVVTVFVLVFLLVYNYSSPFDDTVTHFSDEGPRIGNNLYGYVDVPDGFSVTGSFNPEDANYVGGADGIPEGVELKNEDGTMYIVISLVTADRKRDDYIGFGEGRYCPYDKKNYFYDEFEVFQSVTEDLLSKNILEKEKDGLVSMGISELVGNMWGVVVEWKGEMSDQLYQYRTFIVEDPEQKGVFHCVTAAYTGDNAECVNYAESFSLEPNRP